MALNILVYSDDRNTREQVRLALGKRLDAELPELAYLECATAPAVLKAMDAHAKGARRIDLLVLDGEAVPLGGMGLCRQLKEEVYQCPSALVLIGRPQDAWLATWSNADAAVAAPVDPVALAETAAALLRAGQARLSA
jgi:DNA-binding response OmpR family regulator